MKRFLLYLTLLSSIFVGNLFAQSVREDSPYGLSAEPWMNLQKASVPIVTKHYRNSNFVSSVITNGGFETGDFTGWITQDLTMPFFPLRVYGAGVNVGFGFFTSAPTEGSLAAFHGFDGNGPGTIRIAQDVALPAGAMTLEFDYRGAWDNTFNATLDRIFMLNIEPSGGGTALQTDTILTAPVGTTVIDTSDHGTIDVSAHAGSSVRISFDWFVPENFTGPGFFQLDDVFIISTSAQISVSPATINFGNVAVGDSATATVAVRSIGTADLTVSSISDPGAPFTLSGLPTLPVIISPGGSETFDVTFSPTSAGVVGAAITISSDDADDPTTTLALAGQLNLADSGVCYATLGVIGPDAGSLITIDLTTGGGTLVGVIGIVGDLFATPPLGVPGLAIKSTGEMFGIDISMSSNLYRIDAATGASEFVGTTGLFAVDAIAFDGNDVLYAISSFDSLYILDDATGDATLVGPVSIPAIRGMAFDPTTGILWGSGGGGGGNPGADGIFTIDITNGNATLVGNTTFGGSTPDIHFDQAGNLYGAKGGGMNTNFLISIDKATGAGTVIGDSIGFRAVSGMASRLDRVVLTGVEEAVSGITTSFELAQNYPNPFNPSTTIRYELPFQSHVVLQIFNIIGEEVLTLVDEEKPAGRYDVRWDAGRFASGVYLYRLNAIDLSGGQAGAFIETRKLIFLR